MPRVGLEPDGYFVTYCESTSQARRKSDPCSSQLAVLIPMSSNCTGTIDPNADVAGIGVRTAIYAQAVLTLVQPLLASLDGHISDDELTDLHILYLGILLPGCALLFSAIIQTKTFGLTVYHAIIVLYLSWINNTSALIFFQFALIADRGRDLKRTVGNALELLYGSMLDEDSTDPTMLNLVRDGAKELKSALGAEELGAEKSKEEMRAKKLKEEMWKDVINGLGLLEDYADRRKDASTSQQLEGGAGTEKSPLWRFLKTDGERLRKSLGIPVEPASRSRLQWFRTAITQVANSKWVPGGGHILSLLQRDWVMAGLASAHLTLFAAFGLWLWFEIKGFGQDPECILFTKLFIFHAIPVTSPALRIISIIIYIVCLLPIINIVVFGGMELAAIYGFQRLIAFLRHPQCTRRSKSESPLDSPSILYWFIALTLGVQVFFITCTELTIKNNKHLLKEAEEENWTFGQTLAIALITIPLVQVAKDFQKNLPFLVKKLKKVIRAVWP